MTQNLANLTLSDAQLLAVDQALSEMEMQLTALVALQPEQRRRLKRMGAKSETFCRQALSALEQNPQVVPPNLPLTDAQADLTTLDRLRPRLQRLQRLSERATDTDAVLGSDVMAVALQGYSLLKVAGRNQGLEGLCRTLGTRFSKRSRSVEAEAA